MDGTEHPAIRARVLNVPLGTDLGDATASVILNRCREDPLLLSSTTLLLPNNRAIRAMTGAFVRKARSGLLLPKMVAIGDLALDETLGPMLDPLVDYSSILPVIPAAARLMLLAQLIAKHRPVAHPISPTETLRLAHNLAEMIDELEIEQVSFASFQNVEIATELQGHWQSSYGQLMQILPEYRTALLKKQLLGPSERRNVLLARLSRRLRSSPPSGLLVAAGITTAAKAVAQVLADVAKLPQGIVILPGVDLAMSDDQWESLGPHLPIEGQPARQRSYETHPQFHLKLLFDRMGIARDEVEPVSDGTSVALARAAAITQIFCLPDQTAEWGMLPDRSKKLPNVELFEASDSAEEALAIAIKVREALETPEKRIAVVTPDRELAVRIAAQLRRWNIAVDDSAGKPLLQTPNGTLILALAEAMAGRFSPTSLLAVAKHPLVHAGDGRIAWLDMTRRLDLMLRGPSTGKGLSAITRLLESRKDPDQELVKWWSEYRSLLSVLELDGAVALANVMAKLPQVASALTANAVWKGATGRQLAEHWEEVSACDLSAIDASSISAIPALLGELFGRAVVRPPFGGHPRVAIYGLLEARMQQADLVICAGLNEGTWPQATQPDPWLAPVIRRLLGLANLDRNIGLSAHDLSIALGTAQVLLSRSKRDRSGPTVASRFVLRIKAFLGAELATETTVSSLASLIDEPSEPIQFAERPKPSPSPQQRMVDMSVTDFDQLKSDPYSFYAKRILGLRVLDPVDAEPSYAWRGTLVHDVLEKWFKHDQCDPERLIQRAEALLTNDALDPTMRALWQPRMAAGLRWIADETTRLQAEEGRQLVVAEQRGKIDLLGIKIAGRADRIDRLVDGNLAIIDYKTGGAPKPMQATAGFAMQLGLIGLMAERGAIDGANGKAARFEYWSLAKQKSRFGHIALPTSKKPGDKHVEPSAFVAFVKAQAEAAITEWILGDRAFTAKLRPEFANYGDYNQLMRLQEWDGRQTVSDAFGL